MDQKRASKTQDATELGQLSNRLIEVDTQCDENAATTQSAACASPGFNDTMTSLLPIGVVVVDAEGMIVSANPEAHALLGGLVTRNITAPAGGYQLFVPEGKAYQPDELPLSRSLLLGETVRGEEILVSLTGGEVKSILAATTPITDDYGNITGAIAVFQEISRGKQTNPTQHDMIDFQLLADSAPVMIWMSDETGSLTFFNQLCADFLGRPLADLDTNSWHDDIHPEDRATCADVYASHVEQRRSFRMEHRLRRVDGEYRWVRVGGLPRFRPDGSFAGFVGFCADITDRKQMKADLQDSEIRFRAIFEHAPVGIGLVSITDGRTMQSNPALSSILGYTNRELAEIPFNNYTYPEDIEPNQTLYNEMVTGKRESLQLEKRFMHRDGHIVWGKLVTSLVRNADNDPSYIFGMLQDITEQKQAESQLRWNESLLQAMAAASPFGFYVVDSDTDQVLYYNRRFCEIWRVENMSQRIADGPLYHADVVPHCLALMRRPETFDTEHRNCAHEEELELLDGRTIRRYATLVGDTEGRHLGRFFIFEDITDRKQLETALYQAKIEAERAREQAEYLACTDYLTGLLNRRSFVQRFETEINRAWRESSPISAILADLDDFKAINDTYGHQAGDICLQQFAKALNSMSRPYDFIGRYGGEEFIICLPNTTSEQATMIAERMRGAIEALDNRTPHQPGAIRITASLGVASLDKPGRNDGDLLIKLADDAMYTAKSWGNCVRVAEDPSQLRFDLP